MDRSAFTLRQRGPQRLTHGEMSGKTSEKTAKEGHARAANMHCSHTRTVTALVLPIQNLGRDIACHSEISIAYLIHRLRSYASTTNMLPHAISINQGRAATDEVSLTIKKSLRYHKGR